MKATDVLKAQHREVLARFAELASTDDPSERLRLLDELTDALEMHAELEEEVFYPAIREGDGRQAQALVRDAIAQHHAVDRILAEAPDLDPEAESFSAKIALLEDLVRRHIDVEERELFALAASLTGSDAEELDRRLEAQTTPAP
jgi:iron-sulfur cluster repair protein YtfE (RIC family)